MLNARLKASLSLSRHCSSRARRNESNNSRAHSSAYVPQEQPTVIDEASGRLYRVRKHGNRNLPIPPFMDARVIEAKMRHKQTKKDPVKSELSELQQDLAANVYARAFASPVRFCSLTKARLPAHFLQAYTAEFVQMNSANGKVTERAKIVPVSVKERAPAKDRGRFAHSATYVVNNAKVIDHLEASKGRWQTIPNERMHKQVSQRTALNKAKNKDAWLADPDMKRTTWNDLIRDVDQQLEHLTLPSKLGAETSTSRLSRYFLVVTASGKLSDVNMPQEVASVAILQPASQDFTRNSLRDSLPRSIPQYDLVALCGVDQNQHQDGNNFDTTLSKWQSIVKALEAQSHEDPDASRQSAHNELVLLGIRKSRYTVKLRLALERLRAFVGIS